MSEASTSSRTKRAKIALTKRAITKAIEGRQPDQPERHWFIEPSGLSLKITAAGHASLVWRFKKANEEAMWAGLVLQFKCQRRKRPHSEWAFWLCLRVPSAMDLPLNKPVNSFYCRGCGHRGSVYISAKREGET